MEAIKIFKEYDRNYFLIVYVVVAIMLIAYGNVVHKKHKYEDVWYQIGDGEEECVFFFISMVTCSVFVFSY